MFNAALYGTGMTSQVPVSVLTNMNAVDCNLEIPFLRMGVIVDSNSS